MGGLHQHGGTVSQLPPQLRQGLFFCLKMKDGTNYYVFDAPPEGWEPLDREALDASGNFQDTGYRTPDGEEIPRESILGQFSGGGGGGGKYMWNYEFSGTFNSLINVDDIAGIYVDGVEMPLM